MALSPGQRLGPYELLSPIGEGGMGEVWKARDTRLDRTVALKVSKEQFSARFEREARAIAQLNHPNICTLHDVGPNYLVMEYVEGEPLKGPLSLEKMLEAARQICDALDTAHRKGITHRDLKPANILATKQGIKLLDFGLAKMPADAPEPVNDETVTNALTGAGVVLGTPQYMAPEQLDGKPADARSDIFALGCVLYEIITGKRAFDGKTVSAIAAAILAKDPEALSQLQPESVGDVIRTCLAKDPDERFQNARDVRLALALATRGAPPARTKANWMWIGLAAGCLLIGAAFGTQWKSASKQTSAQPMKFEVQPPANVQFPAGADTLALSPDGLTIAFVASAGSRRLNQRIWVRPLNEIEAHPLAGTEEAQRIFWSPDGQWIGFVSSDKLKKVRVSGGPVEVITDGPVSSVGAAWNERDVIVYGAGRRTFRIPAAGGTPVPIEKGVQEGATTYQFLPGGNRLLYRVNGKAGGVFIGSLDGTISRKILDKPQRVLWHAGYLLMRNGTSLKARRFDTETLELKDEFNVLEDAGDAFTVGGDVVATMRSSLPRLRMVDRTGKQLFLLASDPNASYRHPAFSPDGRRIAADLTPPGDVWLIDPERSASTRLTFEGSTIPVWSPDGSSVYVTGRNGIDRVASDGTGKPTPVWDKLSSHHMSVSPNGKHLVFENLQNGATNLFVLPLDGASPARPLIATRYSEVDPSFSPDGRWIAYASNATGRSELYVESFPPGNGKWQVSNTGGSVGRWTKGGRELVYLKADEILAVDVTPKGGGLAFGPPRSVMTVSGASDSGRFAVSPDGQRFVVNVNPDRSSIVVMTNWKPKR